MFPVLPAEPPAHRKRRIIPHQVTFRKQGREEPDGIIRQRVAVEIVDKKTDVTVSLHPFDLLHQLVVGKMVAEEGRKNNIRPGRQFHLAIIGMNEQDSFVALLFPCICNALSIDINACQGNR